jgi:hypothetical protein
MAKVVNGFRKSLNLCNEAWETVALLTGPSGWTHENIENCLLQLDRYGNILQNQKRQM